MNLLPNNASQWVATWREPGVDRALRGTGLRVTVDSRADKIGAKIRQAQLAKVPFMLVLGPSSLVRSRAWHH